MTALQKTIAELIARQSASENASHISDIDPRALVGVTVVYLIAMLSVPVSNLGMLVWFACYPIVSAPLAHIAYEKLFVKSIYVVPLLVVIAIFNPLYDHRTAFVVGGFAVSQGWVEFVSVMFRGILSVQALLLLVYVCGFNRMCRSLRSLGVPGIVATQLELVYRYLIVLFEEAETMQQARRARGYGRKGYGPRMWGAFVGQLLIRSLERSKRIHMAMLARGFNGAMPQGSSIRWATADTVYCLVWIDVFAVLRFVDLSSLF